MSLSKIKSLEELILFIKSKVQTINSYNKIYEEICSDYAFKTRSTIPIIFLTPSRRIIYANKSFCEMLGYEIDQLIGQKQEIIIAKENETIFNAHNINLLNSDTKKQIYGNQLIFSRIGKTKSCSVIIFPYRDNSCNEIEFLKCIFIDNESNLESKETSTFDKNFLEKYTQNSTTAFWKHNFNLDEYKFLGNYENLLGYKPSELPSCTDLFLLLVHPQDINKIMQLNKPGYEINKNGIDIRLKNKNGLYKWFRIKILSITIENKGNKIIEGFIKNIDDYKKLQLKLYNKERQIILNEENNKKIFKALPIGFILYNSNGDYIESNDEFLRLFNYSSKQQIDKINLFDNHKSFINIIKNFNISAIIAYDPDTKKIYNNYLTAPRTENIKYISIKIISLLDKDLENELDNIQSNIPEDIIKNSHSAYLLVFTDKTSIIKTELALKTDKYNLLKENQILEDKVSEVEISNKQKLSFLTNIGEDIKKPMKSILDLLELAYKADNIEEVKAYLGYIRNNYTTVKDTMDMIIDYSKINNSHNTLKNDTVNIDKLCREIIEVNKLISPKVKFCYIESNLCKFKNLNNERYISQPIVITDKSKIYYTLNKIVSLCISFLPTEKLNIYYNIIHAHEHQIIYIDQNIEIDNYIENNVSDLFIEFVIHIICVSNRETFVNERINKITLLLEPIVEIQKGKIKFGIKDDNSIKIRLTIPYIKANYLDSPWLKSNN